MTEEKLTQGAKANANGRIGEDTLEPLFKINGYEVVKYGDYKKPRKKPIYDQMPKLVIKQYPYTTIYNHPGKTEFLIINRPKDRRIRVEVKWQQAAGSVDEKFPYLWLNCVYSFEEDEIILIVDGGGCKEGAREWLVEQANSRWLLEDENKSIKVMTIAEFIAYFNRYLR